ncbi:MAG TPA: polysaccharide deacetylase family protein [Flavilitoribacter sp.]|nr:polysaccharide deacetylase family protein [Flavilitoribacter sp.]
MKNFSPPVFYYHSVAPERSPDWVLNGLTLKSSVFEDQLKYLESKGLRTIFLDEWLTFRQGEARPEGSEICLTFDDGYLDNWVYAWPLAEKYGVRFTLFVSPECVDPRPVVRSTLKDVWNGKCREEDLETRGYLTWEELKQMQASGVVDIQSHTMSHAKYISAPVMTGFYYGGFKGLHPIWNANPGIKPRYMADALFERRLPLGTPLFKESSAVIARKAVISPEFMEEAAAVAAGFDLTDPARRPAYEEAVVEVYKRYKMEGKLCAGLESEEASRERVIYEVIDSKAIIEENLLKPVQFLCWPHGDNSMEAHKIARSAGYLATTSGKLTGEAREMDRIPRIPADFENSVWVSRQKFHFKIASHYRRQPYYAVWMVNHLKNKMLKRS